MKVSIQAGEGDMVLVLNRIEAEALHVAVNERARALRSARSSLRENIEQVGTGNDLDLHKSMQNTVGALEQREARLNAILDKLSKAREVASGYSASELSPEEE